MFDKEFCGKIGQLLKKADNMQMYYYESHNKLNDIPKELIGGKSLSMVLNRPKDGILFLQKLADPFARFCDAKRKKRSNDWRIAYGRMMLFTKLLNDVLERVDSEEDCCVSTSSKNIIILEYLMEI